LTCDLITLTFDLSISEWRHGPPVSWASFLTIFSSFILYLGSGTGQTDRQTDNGHQCPTLWGIVK